jgi:carbamoyltransferase
LKKRTGLRDIAIGGGSALNCLANGRLLASGEFDHVFVPPAAGDLGTSIGAAQYHHYMALGGTERTELRTHGWGPEFPDDAVLQELRRSGLRFGRLEQRAEAAARSRGQSRCVVPGSHGVRSRTLGFRSILGDPRSVQIKDRIKGTVKFRDAFCPFAPSILREHVKAFLGADYHSPFMTLTFDVLADKRQEIAGVVHVDNTARVQTVSREDHPLYYDLIDNFYRLTRGPSGIEYVLQSCG